MANNTSEFTIEASAEAFDVLSRKLYSNPELAVVRELSTNANDANIEANANRPIEVHLPVTRDDEMYFSVRDFGNGLTDDEVRCVYTSFFVSTKRGNEAVTGAFGLGSKSPFIMSDSFTVTSFNNGKKTVYNMHKENGIPQCTLVSSEDTNEPSGMLINVPINRDRIRTFCDTAWNFYRSTLFMPTINWESDWSIYTGDELIEKFTAARDCFNKTTIFFNSTDVNQLPIKDFGLTVNVAGVAFHNVYTDETSALLKKYKIRFMNILVNKSDVSIVPSREELHYDEKTVRFLNARVKEELGAFFSTINEKNITFEQYKFGKEFSISEFDNYRKAMLAVMDVIDNGNASVASLYSYRGLKKVNTCGTILNQEKCYVVDVSSVKPQIATKMQAYFTGTNEYVALKSKIKNWALLNDSKSDFNVVFSNYPIKTKKFLDRFGIENAFINASDILNVKVEKAPAVKKNGLADKFCTRAAQRYVDNCVFNGPTDDHQYDGYKLIAFAQSATRAALRTIGLAAKLLGTKYIVRENYNIKDNEILEGNMFCDDFLKSPEYAKWLEQKKINVNVEHHLGLPLYYGVRSKDLYAALKVAELPKLKALPEVQHWMNDFEKYDSKLAYFEYADISYDDVDEIKDKFELFKITNINECEKLNIALKYAELELQMSA